MVILGASSATGIFPEATVLYLSRQKLTTSLNPAPSNIRDNVSSCTSLTTLEVFAAFNSKPEAFSRCESGFSVTVSPSTHAIRPAYQFFFAMK